MRPSAQKQTEIQRHRATGTETKRQRPRDRETHKDRDETANRRGRDTVHIPLTLRKVLSERLSNEASYHELDNQK